jgi:hypothetical protein
MKRYALTLLLFLSTTPAMAGTDLMQLGKSVLESSGALHDTNNTKTAGLSNDKIVTGLKEALRVGTKKAVATVGRSGGFMNDAHVHIPLPKPLAKVKSALGLVGAAGIADDLETRMNKAAEAAAPKAASIFGAAVSKMSFQDARGILSGSPDSATQYFKRTTSAELTEAMKPAIDKSLADVGAVQSYKSLTNRVKDLPFASAAKLDLNEYVASKTLDGIFYYLAKQEADIRANPAARTTDVLKAVFR